MIYVGNNYIYRIYKHLNLTSVKLTFIRLAGCQVQVFKTVSIDVGLNHRKLAKFTNLKGVKSRFLTQCLYMLDLTIIKLEFEQT